MIILDSLSKSYPSKNKLISSHIALDNINERFEQGEAVAVIGQNGSGKSTLLSILSGQINSYEGKVEVRGLTAPDFTTAFPVSYAAEQPIFNPTWTVIDLFRFVGQLQGLSKIDYENKIRDITEYFRLSDLLNQTFGSLSKGMRQRINLAQSLISNSDLIVWDEPTSGLDWVFTDLIESKMRELKAKGKTIVFSSHDLHLTKNICDKLLYLKEGKQLYSGTYMGWNQYLCVSKDPLESRLLNQM